MTLWRNTFKNVSDDTNTKYWNVNLFPIINCPECLLIGYHSFLYHSTDVIKCPFHHCLLCKQCPECGVEWSAANMSTERRACKFCSNIFEWSESLNGSNNIIKHTHIEYIKTAIETISTYKHIDNDSIAPYFYRHKEKKLALPNYRDKIHIFYKLKKINKPSWLIFRLSLSIKRVTDSCDTVLLYENSFTKYFSLFNKVMMHESFNDLQNIIFNTGNENGPYNPADFHPPIYEQLNIKNYAAIAFSQWWFIVTGETKKIRAQNKAINIKNRSFFEFFNVEFLKYQNAKYHPAYHTFSAYNTIDMIKKHYTLVLFKELLNYYRYFSKRHFNYYHALSDIVEKKHQALRFSKQLEHSIQYIEILDSPNRYIYSLNALTLKHEEKAFTKMNSKFTSKDKNIILKRIYKINVNSSPKWLSRYSSKAQKAYFKRHGGPYLRVARIFEVDHCGCLPSPKSKNTD